jgi:hypothetical protein
MACNYFTPIPPWHQIHTIRAAFWKKTGQKSAGWARNGRDEAQNAQLGALQPKKCNHGFPGFHGQ